MADIVYEFDTAYGHYMVIDMVYDGRSARLLFSGDRQAAQSGIATDGKPDLLFDYNQRMFELVTGSTPQRLLLIGGGMFTLPTALLQAMPDITIDAVELDDGLAPVATRYFGLIDDPRLRIIHDDGLKFLAANKSRYDMILVDAYTHASAEPTLGSPEAIGHFRRSLTAGGMLAANIISAYFGRRSLALHQLTHDYEHQFAAVTLFPASQSLSLWLPQNLLLIAQTQADSPVDEFLRFRRLEAPAQPFDLRRDISSD